ncbi:hypothetical protein JKP88DRAFT_268116 [Tribonema minus]|uniref:Ubiquitin-like protease family profile domain-containing protein n=1 Tax=Tribonema minus TaxID=303371 RepID=A0A835Z6T0_9STRA|nr:hypothetical protein JKP88DRAFT_268116 [Tribonema minus]
MARAAISSDERKHCRNIQTQIRTATGNLKAAVSAGVSAEQREVIAEVVRAKVRLLSEHAREFGASKGTIKDPDDVVSAAIREAQQLNDHDRDSENGPYAAPTKADDGDGGSDADIDGKKGALKPKAPAASKKRKRRSAAAAPSASKGRGETPGKRQLSAASRASKAEYSDVDSSDPEARCIRSQSHGETGAPPLKSPAIGAPRKRRSPAEAAAPRASNEEVAQLRGQADTTPPMETQIIPPWSVLAEGDSLNPEARCVASVGAAATSTSSARIMAPEARVHQLEAENQQLKAENQQLSISQAAAETELEAAVARASAAEAELEAAVERASAAEAELEALKAATARASAAEATACANEPAVKRARLDAPAPMCDEDPTSDEEVIAHPRCNWQRVKAVQTEIDALFKSKPQECLEVCEKMGLSEGAVKTGLLNHHFLAEDGSYVSFEPKHASHLCTDKLGGVMPFASSDKTILFIRDRWFDGFLDIDSKVEVNGVVPQQYSTIIYQLHALLKRHTHVDKVPRTPRRPQDTVDLDSDSGNSGAAKAAVKLRDTKLKLPVLRFSNLLAQLSAVGFTKEQADAAGALWSWSGTINQETVVLDGPWYTVKGSDLTRIAGKQWLNDVIMDAFLDVSLACPAGSDVMAVPLVARGDQLLPWVRRYEARLDSAAHLVIPLNVANKHWVVGLVDRQQNVLTMYDSCCSAEARPDMELRESQLQQIHEVLSTIHQDHNPIAMTVVEPMRESTERQQTNGSDCGIFVCANAWCHLNNRTFLTQKDAKFFRWYILHILCTRLKRIHGAKLV